MILIVENWEKGSMELAMLLDESPSPMLDSVNSTLEPWAEGGSLAMCLDSAERTGKADLYIIFRSDARATWGSRRITAVAGGVLHCNAVPGRGLKFEVLNRPLFGNIIGQDSAHPYRVVEEAFLAPDPDRAGGKLLKKHQVHPSLGYRVTQRDLMRAEDHGHGVGVDIDYGTGVRIKWVDQTGYSEDWFVADEKGSAEFEFLAVEFARRQYVQVILASLGFVRGVSVAPRSREAMATALLRGMAPQMQALTALLVDNTPTRSAPVENPRTKNKTVGTAPAAPAAQPQTAPLVVASKFSNRLSPATNANSTPADKTPSLVGCQVANAAAKPQGNAVFVQPVTTKSSGPVPLSSEITKRARPVENPSGNGLRAPDAGGSEAGSASRGRDGKQAGGAFLATGLQRPNGAVVGQPRPLAPISHENVRHAAGANQSTSAPPPAVVGQRPPTATPFSRYAAGANHAASAPPAKRRREEPKMEIVELSD